MYIRSALSRTARFLFTHNTYKKLRAFYHLLTGHHSLPLTEIEVADWKVYLQDPRMDQRLSYMLQIFAGESESAITSRYWSVLCRKNVSQLLDMKYDNFKQTVALNYFTWIIGKEDPQAVFLLNYFSKDTLTLIKKRVDASKQHDFMTEKQAKFYNLITYLLWIFTEKTVGSDLLTKLEEPDEGNPPSVELNGKKISQDLANSILEYHSITQGIPNIESLGTIIELGVGYGRTAFVFLKLLQKVRYILVDIPPALYIAEKYLSSQFADRKIFKYRQFQKFADVAAEFKEAQIVFLMPDQLSLLPDQIADLFLAIDCLHEMRPEQIKSYFLTVDRLSSNFYIKCWKKTIIPYDDITLTQDDYPFLPHWQNLFFRDCIVQNTYFEAMFHSRRNQEVERPGKNSIKRS
jgi:putative sugar O-methyltransferase